MKRAFFLINFMILIFCGLLPLACSIDEGDEAAIVTLDTGLYRDEEKIRRGAPPSDISQINLTVTGKYMTEIQRNIPLDTGMITVRVPAGRSRTFEILAAVAPGAAGPVKSYRGSMKMNLEPRTNIEVPIRVDIYETKILIPDPLNSRIIQIDNLDGTSAETGETWKTLKASDLADAGFTSFHPADVDIDSLGRILIAAEYSTGAAPLNGILRIDDINDITPYESFEELPVVTAVAADRYNGFVYYSDSTSVYRCDMDGASQEKFIEYVEESDGISGLAVDPANSLIFISCINNFQVFDLATGENLAVFNTLNEDGSEASDVIVSASGICGALSKADIDGSGSNMIVRFAFDAENHILSAAESYIINLAGPRRFLSPTNSGICFIDETYNMGPGTLDRIIYMDDTDGTGRKEYGSTGEGEPGYFRFFKQ